MLTKIKFHSQADHPMFYGKRWAHPWLELFMCSVVYSKFMVHWYKYNILISCATLYLLFQTSQVHWTQCQACTNISDIYAYVYIEHIAGYHPTCTQCGDLGGNPPKRDGEVAKPVYNCGQGNCPLGQVPGASARRLGAPNFPIGYAFPLSPTRLHASSASLLVRSKKNLSPGPEFNYIINQDIFFGFNYFKNALFSIMVCHPASNCTKLPSQAIMIGTKAWSGSRNIDEIIKISTKSPRVEYSSYFVSYLFNNPKLSIHNVFLPNWGYHMIYSHVLAPARNLWLCSYQSHHGGHHWPET